MTRPRAVSIPTTIYEEDYDPRGSQNRKNSIVIIHIGPPPRTKRDASRFVVPCVDKTSSILDSDNKTPTVSCETVLKKENARKSHPIPYRTAIVRREMREIVVRQEKCEIKTIYGISNDSRDADALMMQDEDSDREDDVSANNGVYDKRCCIWTDILVILCVIVICAGVIMVSALLLP